MYTKISNLRKPLIRSSDSFGPCIQGKHPLTALAAKRNSSSKRSRAERCIEAVLGGEYIAKNEEGDQSENACDSMAQKLMYKSVMARKYGSAGDWPNRTSSFSGTPVHV